MLIRLLQQKADGKDVNLEEIIGEYECSKVPQALFESNGSMRHGYRAVWLTDVFKETHLKMEEKLLDFGWKMGVIHLETVSLTVPPLNELTHTSCVSPANALVIVFALNFKCRVVLLASAKGPMPNVGE